MMIAEIIDEMISAGCQVKAIVGNQMQLVAPEAPPEPLLAVIGEYKPSLIQYLVYWHDFYQERAAIREYDGHMTRDLAEQWAYSEMLVLWWEQNNSSDFPYGWQGYALNVMDVIGLKPPDGWLEIAQT